MARDKLVTPGGWWWSPAAGTAPRGSVRSNRFLLDGELRLSKMWQSHKARDLIRDHRVLVHSIVANRDGANGEVKMRGLAIEETTRRPRPYCAAVAVLGWQPEEPTSACSASTSPT